ncbi:lipase family protein [Dyella mobilis]|uniref:Lipase family protein n=1 Tax=Dyella mobilis TaxID=1849582 RepID=A0ABS2KAR6_9GAMM|nr:lipase family protein [Dyella mobilis]MBM7127963.1 lipase family protein [Dyella mobilis]GLQ99215.1 lipase [Dyella mobilis]
MARELSPAQVGEVAESVYALRLSRDVIDVANSAPGTREIFDLLRSSCLTGVTGLGGPIQQTTGFGYVAWGKGGRQGECLIAVRGTFKTSAYDWLTNIRMGGVIGPSGFLVHAGFWRGAQSVLPQINDKLRGRNPSTLHVVGHSLGGAMATLIADSLSSMGCPVRLYTFGAPKCGLEDHAQYLTSRLGADNIYRVYHDTDPVPMVPVFPYCHVPLDSNAFRLKGPGTRINVGAHLMPEYRNSVGDTAWSALPVILPKHSSFEQASDWLAQAAKDSGPFIMLSATALRLILSALDWILKQVGKTAALALYVGSTLLDGLARLLYSGVLQSIQMAETIRNMLNAALRFMGRTAIATGNMTVSFIEYVLGLLFRFVAAIARRAVDMLD